MNSNETALESVHSLFPGGPSSAERGSAWAPDDAIGRAGPVLLRQLAVTARLCLCLNIHLGRAMSLRRVWARCGRRAAALAALALLAALSARATTAQDASAAYRAPAAALAHLLADYSSHAPEAGAWAVADERGNYSEWRYSVAFECGPRCEGSAAVHATADGAPRHGLAPRHRVRLQLRACSRPPLLPWPTLCDETELEWVVAERRGGGCVVHERARARCGVLRVLSGACARALRRRSDALHARLRADLDVAINTSM